MTKKLVGTPAAKVVSPSLARRPTGYASAEANEFFELTMRHWNTIAGTLLKDEVYLPVLLEDAHGLASGNDWARSPAH